MNLEFDATQEQPIVEQEQAAPVEQPVDHSASISAIQDYQAWLSNQPRQVGPFGKFWNDEEGQALVKAFCEEQGWS